MSAKWYDATWGALQHETDPLRWRKTRSRVLIKEDIFHEGLSTDWIDRVFAVMALSPQHTFLVLTKRSKRMREYFAARGSGDPWAEAADEIADMIGMKEHPVVLEPRDIPLPNVWLGVSAEDQARADERIPDLLATPAAVRFVSAELLLGAIDFHDYFIRAVNGFSGRLDWIIVSGESGKDARPLHPQWVRDIRDQCKEAGVPFWFEGWGEFAPSSLGPWVARASQEERALIKGEWTGSMAPITAAHPDTMNRVGKRRAGRLLDGVEHNEFPETRS